MEEKILCGDCLEVLKTLPDNTVDCCVTSPPYYGLRDYGTGKWIGGDPNCPHKRLSKYSAKTITGHAQIELAGNVGDAIYKSVCPLCGAVREDKQIGLEETPEAYIQKLVLVFREVRRVLKDDGTLWVNIGDSYNGSGGNHKSTHNNDSGFQGVMGEKYGGRGNRLDSCKPKDLIGIPWMLAFALREDGWYLRQDIIWHKPNPMPESVKDRCTKSHEYIFLLSKSPKYYFNNEAIQEDVTTHEQRPYGIVREREYGYESKRNLHPDVYSPRTKNVMSKGQTPNTMHLRREDGLKDVNYIFRNKRDVWTIPVQPTKEAHFATYPEKLVEPCILAGSRPGGVVLDPFFGSGTTGRVAVRHGRGYIGIELNPEYVEIEKKRLNNVQVALF